MESGGQVVQSEEMADIVQSSAHEGIIAPSLLGSGDANLGICGDAAALEESMIIKRRKLLGTYIVSRVVKAISVILSNTIYC
jgi:hypothetical protein